MAWGDRKRRRKIGKLAMELDQHAFSLLVHQLVQEQKEVETEYVRKSADFFMDIGHQDKAALLYKALDNQQGYADALYEKGDLEEALAVFEDAGDQEGAAWATHKHMEKLKRQDRYSDLIEFAKEQELPEIVHKYACHLALEELRKRHTLKNDNYHFLVASLVKDAAFAKERIEKPEERISGSYKLLNASASFFMKAGNKMEKAPEPFLQAKDLYEIMGKYDMGEDESKRVERLRKTAYASAAEEYQKIWEFEDAVHYFEQAEMPEKATGCKVRYVVHALSNSPKNMPAILRYVEEHDISGAVARNFLKVVHAGPPDLDLKIIRFLQKVGREEEAAMLERQTYQEYMKLGKYEDAGLFAAGVKNSSMQRQLQDIKYLLG